MPAEIEIHMLRQPDDSTCGPTCLQAVYGHYGDAVPLVQVIDEVQHLPRGGTLAVMLGLHARRRGYKARIYTCNMQVFDPSWFGPHAPPLHERLRLRLKARPRGKLATAIRAYLAFLELGGEIRLEDLNEDLVMSYLRQGVPVLTGLSATWLYGCPRERGRPLEFDDVDGEPQGHFVVLCGYEAETRVISVADPLGPNPLAPSSRYHVHVDRLICSVLLGILTYDANLLIVEPS